MNLGDAHDQGVLTGEKNVRNLEQRLAKVFTKIFNWLYAWIELFIG